MVPTLGAKGEGEDGDRGTLRMDSQPIRRNSGDRMARHFPTGGSEGLAPAHFSSGRRGSLAEMGEF